MHDEQLQILLFPSLWSAALSKLVIHRQVVEWGDRPTKIGDRLLLVKERLAEMVASLAEEEWEGAAKR